VGPILPFMAHFIDIKNIKDEKGEIGIIDGPESLPFDVKRVLFIKDSTEKRGSHSHKKTIQALICLTGSSEIYTNNGNVKETFILDSSDKCLILNPEDWHTMKNNSKETVLLALGSEYYDPEDYIKEEP
jgi:hypothetical protein